MSKVDTISNLSPEIQKEAESFKIPELDLQKKEGWQKRLNDKEYFNSLAIKARAQNTEEYPEIHRKIDLISNEINSIDNIGGLLSLTKRLETPEGQKIIKISDINLNKIVYKITDKINNHLMRDVRQYPTVESGGFDRRQIDDYLEFLNSDPLLNKNQKNSCIKFLTQNDRGILRNVAREKFPSESQLFDGEIIDELKNREKIDLAVVKDFGCNYYKEILFNNKDFQDFLMNSKDKIQTDIMAAINDRIDHYDIQEFASWKIQSPKEFLKILVHSIRGIKDSERKEQLLDAYESFTNDSLYKIDSKILDHFPALSKDIFWRIESDYLDLETQDAKKPVFYENFSEQFIKKLLEFRTFSHRLITHVSTINVSQLFNYNNFKKAYDSENPNEVMKHTAIAYELFMDLIEMPKRIQAESLSDKEDKMQSEILSIGGLSSQNEVLNYASTLDNSKSSLEQTIINCPEFAADKLDFLCEKLNIPKVNINNEYETQVYRSIRDNLHQAINLITHKDSFSLETDKIKKAVCDVLASDIRTGTLWRTDEIIERKKDLFLSEIDIAKAASEAGRQLISHEKYDDVLNLLKEKEKFYLTENDIQSLLSSTFVGARASGNFEKIFAFPDELLHLSEEKYHFLEFREKIGFPSVELYNQFFNFKERENSKGLSGMIEKLQKEFLFLRNNIINDQINTNMLDKDYLKKYFAKFTRIDVSQWGSHSEKAMLDMIDRYNNLNDNNEIESLKEYFKPSETILINKVNLEKQDEYKYSESFVSRYQTIINSLRESSHLSKEKKPFSKLSEAIGDSVNQLINSMEQKLTGIENLKARHNLSSSIENLKKIDIRSVKNFQENFLLLSQYKEFHEHLRQFVFLMAFEKNKSQEELAKRFLNIDKPTLGDISSMIEFIDHIVNQETLSEYFTNKKAAKSFREIINMRAFEEEMVRAQNQEKKGTTNVKFIPSRGVLMEFSGYIADVCWASKYESIAKQFPNFTSIIMIQNPDSKYERLAGASMMIETNDSEGNPLLVIRGLNPIENIINQLDIEDFYKKFVEYAQSIIENSERKLAIIVDDHSGGSATNRPAMYSYLEKKVKSPENLVALNSENDTTFNGYNIVNNCYLVK